VVFTVLCATNVGLPLSDWTLLSNVVVENPPTSSDSPTRRRRPTAIVSTRSAHRNLFRNLKLNSPHDWRHNVKQAFALRPEISVYQPQLAVKILRSPFSKSVFIRVHPWLNAVSADLPSAAMIPGCTRPGTTSPCVSNAGFTGPPCALIVRQAPLPRRRPQPSQRL
jgi:hypothetical protein